MKDDSRTALGRARPIGVLAGGALGLWLIACGAVYPELSAPVRTAPEGRDLQPPPPEDLLYIVFKGAEIPPKTRDGRKWDAVGGAAPDAFAKLIVDDAVIITTPVHSNTLKPTWPDQKRANYRVRAGARAKVELWDSNAINNRPICVKGLEDLVSSAGSGGIDISCDSGARVILVVERAHAKLGIGLHYELRTEAIYVTRVLTESPAARAGIAKGDQILKLQGKEVKGMDEGQARSLVNANAAGGLSLSVRHADGTVVDVTVKDGPIYPSVDEGLPID
jgi:hypothetical protein